MFKERILFVGGVILAMIGLCVLAFIMLFLFETFQMFEKIDYVLGNLPIWIPLTGLGLFIVYLLCRFIYWLLIQPYLNYRRTKRGTKI